MNFRQRSQAPCRSKQSTESSKKSFQKERINYDKINEPNDDSHTSTPVSRHTLLLSSTIAQPLDNTSAADAPIAGPTLTLNVEELVEITGYRQPGKICAQLTKQGIAFFSAPDGYPRVLRSTLESAASTRNTNRANRRPDFAALDRGRAK